VPYTKHNSSATILLKAEEPLDLEVVFQRVKECMLTDFQPGSDPGLCVAAVVPEEVIQFGRRAKPSWSLRKKRAGWPVSLGSCSKVWAAPKAA
jgi:hypothetical protein